MRELTYLPISIYIGTYSRQSITICTFKIYLEKSLQLLVHIPFLLIIYDAQHIYLREQYSPNLLDIQSPQLEKSSYKIYKRMRTLYCGVA